MNITRIGVRGRAHSYKINSLVRQGFKPMNILSLGKELRFDIDSAREKSCIAYMDEICYDYEIIMRRGAKHSLRTLITNNGLFIGLIISMAMLILSSLFVMDIKIVGADNIDNTMIYERVKDAGIGRFSFIYTIDKVAAENSITAIDGVSSVSIEIKGVRVYVYIYEELPKENINNYLQPVPLISEYDAIVTRVVTLTGTPLVETGSTVYKGQTLIAPYVVSNDNSEEDDNLEDIIPIRATGMVYGRVWHSKSVKFYSEVISYERTGNFIEVAEPSYIFSSKSKPKVPYEHYEVEESTYYYNAIFPLKVRYIRYYETKEVIIVKDLEHELSNIVSKAYIELRADIPPHAEVIRYWTIIKEVDNYTNIDVYLETEQRIDDGGKFGEDDYEDFGQT